MTDKTGTEFLAKVDFALDELEGYGMLDAYAAHAAALVLVSSWRDAIRDGAKPADLIPDIDEAITELLAFKKLLLG